MEKGNHLAERKLDQGLKPEITQAIDADIILGNPKHNCNYHGICEIHPSNTFGHHSEHPRLSLSKARILLSKDGELEFFFLKKTISDKTKRFHFSETFFTISESVRIPLFVSDFLETTYIIQPGKHFITRGAGYYKLTFKRTIE